MEISNRMYSKTELGLLFFPEATSKATARRHLMDWIKRCIPLSHDRIIYNVFDDIITVVVIEVEGHYNDK